MHFFKTVFSPKTIMECFSLALRFVGAAYAVIGAVSADFADLEIGAVLLLLALCLWLVANMHNKKVEILRENGFRVQARIRFIRKYWLTGISCGAQRHPWRFFYEYKYGGESYRGRSDLLWEHPDFGSGDPVTVLIDENNPEKSCPDFIPAFK
ncbi:DUF3592 domain-containing protein [Caproicibacter sp. BJN0012]|uniref:DUF3592 domain-containing protein n=1 Tax=Caproicibacter sp. BJN0012 TaxID=3110227 RepID=UPI002E11A28F